MWNIGRFQLFGLLGAGTVVAAVSYFRFKMEKSSKNSNYSEKCESCIRMVDRVVELKNPSVHIKNRGKVSDYLCQFYLDGLSKLTVVADFDFTMSRFHEDGNACQTCHGALSTSSLIPKDVQEKFRKLYDFYHPLEMDHETSTKEKEIYMEEWWQKSAELILGCHLNQNDIKNIVKDSKVRLRTGCDLMLKTLKKKEVPLFVISAGLGDLIFETLEQQASIYENMTILANFMKFTSDGAHTAFLNETIHCCNKNQVPVNHSESFEILSDRRNAILIGDIIEDSEMVKELSNLENVLKIGYLNNNFKEFLPKYMDTFDIVLVDDQTLDVVNGILNLVSK